MRDFFTHVFMGLLFMAAGAVLLGAFAAGCWLFSTYPAVGIPVVVIVVAWFIGAAIDGLC